MVLAKNEDGKFGDQKYLDDWTTRFSGIHVLRHLGGGVAPWNVRKYQITRGPRVNDSPVVFYHFHNLKAYPDGSFNLAGGNYYLPDGAVKHIYLPFLRSLEESLQRVREIQSGLQRRHCYPNPGNPRHAQSHKKTASWNLPSGGISEGLPFLTGETAFRQMLFLNAAPIPAPGYQC